MNNFLKFLGSILVTLVVLVCLSKYSHSHEQHHGEALAYGSVTHGTNLYYFSYTKDDLGYHLVLDDDVEPWLVCALARKQSKYVIATVTNPTTNNTVSCGVRALR